MHSDTEAQVDTAAACFAHGLAHLIAVFGYVDGLGRAENVIRTLLEARQQDGHPALDAGVVPMLRA